jgi:S1-C subfamily serine protease
MPESKDRPSAVATAVVVAAALAALIAGAIWLNRPAPAPRDTAAAMPAPGIAPEGSKTPAPESAVAVPPVEPTNATNPGNPVNPASPAGSLEDIISRVMPAVVLIETPAGRGSGFFIARDTLLTNVHVVGTSGSVTIVRVNGARDTASVVASSTDFDVAVLKVSNPDPNQAVIAMGSAASARVGSEVIAIGSALGTLQNTVTRGIVSGIRRSGNATLVQTDAAINPGNSGGPLLDREGAAIGITTMGYRNSQGLNFAVAIEHARGLLDGRAGATALPAPSATSGAASVPGLSPTIASDSDRARENATRLFEQAIAQIAQQADAIDADWQRFRSSCYQSRIAAAFDREWLAALDQSPGRAMRDPISAGCSPWFATIAGQAAAVRDGVLQASESARRAGVFPGTQRDTLRKYRLQVQ